MLLRMQKTVLAIVLSTLYCMGCGDGIESRYTAYYSAQVAVNGGTLCFSVTDQSESQSSPPKVSYIDIILHRDNTENIIWSASFPNAGKLLPPTECISYDGASLERGSVYSVSISEVILPPENRWSSRYYVSFFCLAEEQGKTVVHRLDRSNDCPSKEP